MGKCVVWIEGVDFFETLFDTQKLSVLRGASRTLEAMPILAQKHFNEHFNGSTIVMQGASIAGLIVEGEQTAVEAALEDFKTNQLKQCEKPEDVKSMVGSSESAITFAPLAHMRFQSAVVPENGNIEIALAKARAKVRVKQLKGEGIFPAAAGTKMCEYDRTRAAMATPTAVPEGDAHLSRATAARWHFGRHERQYLYKGSAFASDCFTDDFQTMVQCPPKPNGKELPISAQNKIAVFTADGDKFGSELIPALSKLCGGHDKGLAVLAAFMKKEMNCLLAHIVSELKKFGPGAAIVTDKKNVRRIRFETLLFGGDDVIFIVPAWLGLWLAKTFFDYTSNWKIKVGTEELPVKFSAGLVFANTKTPIRTLREISLDLCLSAKMVGGLDIEILESIEPPHGGLGDHRKRLTGFEDGELFAITAAQVSKRLNALKSFWLEPTNFPASQAYHALKAAKPLNGLNATTAMQNHFAEYGAGAGKGHSQKLTDLGLLAGGQATALDLYRILQLRDYVKADGMVIP